MAKKQVKIFPDGNQVFTGDVVYVDNGKHRECVNIIEFIPYQDVFEGETYHTLVNFDEQWFRRYGTKYIQEYFPFSIDFFVSQFNGNDSYKIEHRNPSDTVVYLEGEPIIVVGSDNDGRVVKMKTVCNYGTRMPLAIINDVIDRSME